jgi:hypothetical protein
MTPPTVNTFKPTTVPEAGARTSASLRSKSSEAMRVE